MKRLQNIIEGVLNVQDIDNQIDKYAESGWINDAVKKLRSHRITVDEFWKECELRYPAYNGPMCIKSIANQSRFIILHLYQSGQPVMYVWHMTSTLRGLCNIMRFSDKMCQVLGGQYNYNGQNDMRSLTQLLKYNPKILLLPKRDIIYNFWSALS